MQDFHRLVVWQKAHALSLEIFHECAAFARGDGISLVSQLRRAAFSVPATIAEGAGKASQTEFRRYIDIALGSAAEMRHHLLVARDLNLIEVARHAELDTRAEEIRKMLSGLRRRLEH